jgi:flagellar biosynthetic protein FliO
MIFILALILISVILLKRYMPHRFGPLGHKRRIQVLETVPIGEKRSLTLVEFDGASLLLASTPGGVSLLKEAHAVRDDRPAVSEGDSLKPKASEKVGRFADTLNAEVRASMDVPRPTVLSRLSRLREELEAR